MGTNASKIRALVGIGGLALVVCVAIFIWQQQHSQAQSRKSSEKGLPSGIVWYGVLEDGLEVAKETRRPIFLLSAAPQCAGTPGMW